jgi:hypothetical protein
MDHMQSVHHWNEIYEQDFDKARELTIRDE